MLEVQSHQEASCVFGISSTRQILQLLLRKDNQLPIDLLARYIMEVFSRRGATWAALTLALLVGNHRSTKRKLLFSHNSQNSIHNKLIGPHYWALCGDTTINPVKVKQTIG